MAKNAKYDADMEAVVLEWIEGKINFLNFFQFLSSDSEKAVIPLINSVHIKIRSTIKLENRR